MLLLLISILGRTITRRPPYSSYGNKYCSSINTIEAHDYDNEQINIQVDEIITADCVKYFTPDKLDQAH